MPPSSEKKVSLGVQQEDLLTSSSAPRILDFPSPPYMMLTSLLIARDRDSGGFCKSTNQSRGASATCAF